MTEGKLRERIFQQSNEKAWDVIEEARNDFFIMKKTDHINHWVAEWFVKWFGEKPIEQMKAKR